MASWFDFDFMFRIPGHPRAVLGRLGAVLRWFGRFGRVLRRLGVAFFEIVFGVLARLGRTRFSYRFLVDFVSQLRPPKPKNR